MVRPPYFDRYGIKKGAWSDEEDNILRAHIEQHGHPNWRLLPFLAGLQRCGKSCRLRWVNYLQPGVRRGNFSKEEEDLIIKLQAILGNKWSIIAKKFPGRTDNDIKNYWNAHINKRKKRNSVVTRATGVADQVGQDEPSSELSSCMTTDHHHGATSFYNVFAPNYCAENPENIHDTSLIGDAYLDEQFGGHLLSEQYEGHLLSEIYYDRSQVSMDLPPFPGEEFNEFGSCLNDMSAFPDSLDRVTDSWNSTTAESQEIFWSGQFGEVTLWHFDNNMNVF